MDAEKLMKSIEAVKVPRGYQMDSDEFAVLLDAAGGDELRLSVYASHYGFLKGQRATRAEGKRKAKERYHREMEKHAPGYGLLMALIEKNMSNERFIEMMCTRARIIEDILKKKSEEKVNEN